MVPAALQAGLPRDRRKSERREGCELRPRPRELVCGANDLAVGLVIDGLTITLLGVDDAKVFQLPDQLLPRTGLLDHLIEAEVGTGCIDKDRPTNRTPALATIDGAAKIDLTSSGQLLADNPQRQELVALQAQDGAQAFDVSWL